jgi:SAM-dependent methyltransferase
MAYEKFACHYDRLMAEMPYPEWTELLQTCFAEFGKPGEIVDLGCGTGTLAIELAKMGIQVIGIDLSDDMLAIASQKAEEETFPRGGSVTWLEQDMREWTVAKQVDAVLSLCDSLNYIMEEDGVQQVFQHVFEGLRPGGWFVFDVHTPYQLEQYAEHQPFMLNEDDIAYIWTSEYEENRREIEHAITFFVRAGETEMFTRFEEVHSQRAYPLEWLRSELGVAGFVDIRLTADFTWEAPTEKSGRAFFIAQKGIESV